MNDKSETTPRREIVTVLEPEDEYTHSPDESSNYNESMYLNGFDLKTEVGGWFRLGNRVNEGYAEMSVCVYLPDGRVGFMYDRPQITNNDQMSAGGLTISVVEPFEHLEVTYDAKICVLDDPREMADPRNAFKNNPIVNCQANLVMKGVSPMFGGMPQYADGSPIIADPTKSFAKAHYEQHTAVTGEIVVGEEVVEIDGLGLRDKSWGPRYWQAIDWYRWLPIMFTPEFGMMISVVCNDGAPKPGGMVLEGDEYKLIRDCSIESNFDSAGYQTDMACFVETDDTTYEVKGEVLSLIPLRSRRKNPDGELLHTRITEGMTRYECNGHTGIGMSEYLDQIVDGQPSGISQ